MHKVEQYYEDATLSDIPMLDYAWKDEQEYNIAVCNEYPDRYCLMDRRNVYQGGNPIEFCDIYSRDKQFIHVKSIMVQVFLVICSSKDMFLQRISLI